MLLRLWKGSESWIVNLLPDGSRLAILLPGPLRVENWDTRKKDLMPTGVVGCLTIVKRFGRRRSKEGSCIRFLYVLYTCPLRVAIVCDDSACDSPQVTIHWGATLFSRVKSQDPSCLQPFFRLIINNIKLNRFLANERLAKLIKHLQSNFILHTNWFWGRCIVHLAQRISTTIFILFHHRHKYTTHKLSQGNRVTENKTETAHVPKK